MCNRCKQFFSFRVIYSSIFTICTEMANQSISSDIESDSVEEEEEVMVEEKEKEEEEKKKEEEEGETQTNPKKCKLSA